MINYAHRGASEYAAQNTLAAFYLGLACQANGIETDIQLTSDGIPVLFHDDVVDHTTNGFGKVGSLALSELRELVVHGKLIDDKVVTLEEFFEHFGWREIHLALELKCANVSKPTADLVRQYGTESRTYITSFHFDYLAEMRCYAPELKLGYLVSEISDDVNCKINQLGIEQICPPSWLVTPELVDFYKQRGISVRAWGVRNMQDMVRCVVAGVDGMTINYPDKLATYLAGNEAPINNVR